MQTIVMNTPGYVGADLNALIDEALISALDRRLIDRLISNNNESEHKIDFNLSQNCNFLVKIWLNCIFLLKNIFSNQVIEIIKKKLDVNDGSKEASQNAVEINQQDFNVYLKEIDLNKKINYFNLTY